MAAAIDRGRGARRPEAEAAAETDPDLLRAILSVELLLVFCYQQVLQSETLAPEAEPAIRHLLSQEETHIDVMSDELAKLGSCRHRRPAASRRPTASWAQLHASGSLAALHIAAGQPAAARAVEELAQGAYYCRSRSSPIAAGPACASILAAEAQHYTVLGTLLHRGRSTRRCPARSSRAAADGLS